MINGPLPAVNFQVPKRVTMILQPCHPMHLHGIPQQVIALDGYPVPQPYQQDTVLVAPGQRVDVLVSASELGVWAFHCHVLSHAETEAGMFGMVTAMIIQ